MKVRIIEGFEIKEDWIQNSNYPEPPDTHPSDLSSDNLEMWSRYKAAVETFYKECVEKCTCNESDKNHNICPVCDERKYNKINDAFNNLLN